MFYRKPLAEEVFDAKQAWVEADDQFLTEQGLATSEAIVEVEAKLVRAMRRANKMAQAAERKLMRVLKRIDRDI